jgi:hypothetical protein
MEILIALIMIIAVGVVMGLLIYNQPLNALRAFLFIVFVSYCIERWG